MRNIEKLVAEGNATLNARDNLTLPELDELVSVGTVKENDYIGNMRGIALAAYFAGYAAGKRRRLIDTF